MSAEPQHPALRDAWWAFLEARFTDRATLAAGLAELDAPALVSLAAHVIVARNLVRARDQGPEIEGQRLNPLATEELTEWIVGKGRASWRSCLGAPDALLARLYARFLEASSPQLLGEIFHAYTARGAGDLNDAVDAYLAADA
ncbi:MAG: hypothetical protein KC933_22665 [Myxococcales bacterium]|nr:hypothetical protein [Myxococcales bacterium]MCB9645972.1 hypothetical protein [Deltaproteobacteria bacterium]